MASGIERYFQIARCFRDEDLRADRQPEFTQIDIEMSFCTQDDILELIERMVARLFKEALGEEITIPFPRLTYYDAMERYGSDKPDTRFGLELRDISATAKMRFSGFRKAVEKGGVVKELTPRAAAVSAAGKLTN